MVKSLNAVITNGTMRGARGAKDLAGEAVLQLHRLAFYLGRWRCVRKVETSKSNSTAAATFEVQKNLQNG